MRVAGVAEHSTTAVIRDCFVDACGDLIRDDRDPYRINMRLQRAIVDAEKAKSPSIRDFFDIKQKINANFHRKFGVCMWRKK